MRLLKILCAQVFRGGDLDTLHSPPQPSLAVVLMKVTCPDNRTYTEQGVVRLSAEDKFKDRVRCLGNELRLLDWDESYASAILIFKNSELDKKFKAASAALENHSKPTSCCSVQ